MSALIAKHVVVTLMLAASVAFSVTAHAQVNLDKSKPNTVEPSVTSADSAAGLLPNQVSEATRSKKDPIVAIIYSVMLPGLGQIYSEEYWKAPIFLAAATTSAYLFFDNHSKYREANRVYLAAKDINASASKLDQLLRTREAYRDNRDLSAAVLVTTYIIAAVDAYVGAHLFDFDVSDDVSMRVGPISTSPVGLSIVARF